MKLKIKFILLIYFLLLVCKSSFAQQDSVALTTDSIHNDFLNTQSKQLQEMESARLLDSVKKVELQKQLGGLSIEDNSKKEELLKELEILKIQNAERRSEKIQKIDSLRKFVKGYPVIPFLTDTLFSIFNKVGSLTAKDRAEAITIRINKLADDYSFQPDSMKVVESETTIDIVYGETIIMSVSENDALWQNTTKQNLASQYKDIIGQSITNYKQATSWQTLSKQIGLAFLVLILLGKLIHLIVKLFRYTKTKIESQKDLLLKGIKIRNYELFTATSQLNFFIRINTVVKWMVIIIVVYLTLPVLFSFFPWTKGFATTLISYVMNPLKNIIRAAWNYLPNLFTIIVIAIVFRYIIKGIRFLKDEVEIGALQIPGFYPDWANPTFQIIKVLLYAFLFIVIFPYLPGSESPVFKGVSVFLGVLFTFGSSGSLSNVIAGLVLTYMRAFKIGDRVKIGDITGDIIETSLLVTRIRSIKNEIISLPNSNVMSSHTINYSSESIGRGLIIHSTVTIGYDVPWKEMHQALINAATRTEFILKDPKPFVLQTSLEDFYVSYQINAYTREPNLQAEIYSTLHQNIQDCCNEVGIEIMSPHYRASRDGNTTTIPSSYIGKDYKPPSFNIKFDKE